QYFLTFEAEADARFDERTLKVVLSARSSGQTEEFGELAIDVAGERELERDLRLGPAHPPLAKAA
ncbi:MAG: hypothetical protein HY303_13595, partial [Candidatus Wallbacteria bacterium]|nr:hypothetical protein [Candidatus Wallbacteria bacterium]